MYKATKINYWPQVPMKGTVNMQKMTSVYMTVYEEIDGAMMTLL